MAGIDFNELKKTAVEKAEMLAGKAAVLAKAAAEKTKVAAKIGKLNAEILGEKENAKKAYQELGKLYYDYFKVDPHEPMIDLIAAIDASNAAIAAKKAEIEELKNANPDVEAEAYEAEAEDVAIPEAVEETVEEAVCECTEACEEEAAEPCDECCCGSDTEETEE